MKISILVGGRFHAFYLARYFQVHGVLHRLVSSYPKFAVRRYGIDHRLIRSVVLKELIERGWRRFFGREFSNIRLGNLFDRIAALLLPMDSDVYILWSGFAEHCIGRIRKHNPNALIVLERSSAHIEVQAQLLAAIHGKALVQPEMVAKEMREYQLCDRINTTGQFAKSTFVPYGLQDKIWVNCMAVDLGDFPLQSRRQRQQDDAFVVGYVGAMSAQKNVAGLIAAVESLNQQGCAVQLHLVGGIDDASFDRTLLNKPFITYRGILPQQTLAQAAYQAMDVFVLNSVQDGFGLVLLQAMATGLPVIATTNTGGPDVIVEGVNGFVIPIHADTELKTCIKQLYQNPERCAEMGRRAHESVAAGGWSWDDYGKRYLEHIAQAIASGASKTA